MSSAGKNQQGSVLVIALILLVLLTVIGISASRNTEIETMIAGNERINKQNFYIAEGSAMRAAQLMENQDFKSSPLSWVMDESNRNSSGDLLPAAAYSDLESHIHEKENWTDAFSQSYSELEGDARYLAVSLGVVRGGSLDMSKPKVYEFAIFGRSDFRDGSGLVALGYRKAY
ncbi:MAG: PilX N-terminal domain-containing pilus assembly protein [Desulfobacteraceae bacterium]